MHTAYIYKIKEENLPKLSVYRIWRKSLRTQERIRLIHGKRAIGVRAIEVLLYFGQLSSSVDPCCLYTLYSGHLLYSMRSLLFVYIIFWSPFIFNRSLLYVYTIFWTAFVFNRSLFVYTIFWPPFIFNEDFAVCIHYILDNFHLQ